MMRTRHPGALTRWRAEFVPAALAAAALAFALTLLVTAYGAYEVRAAVDSRRGPVYTTESGAGTTSLATQFDTLPGVGQLSVVLVKPKDSRSPLPPGVPRLDPGEVVLSPALAKYAVEHPRERIRERYGRVVGTIGADGLGAPDEYLVYGNPRISPEGAQHVSAFGVTPTYSPWQVSTSTAVFGESLQIFGLAHPFLGTALLVLTPAVLLLVAASSTGARQRRHRDAILEALGAPPTFRRTTRALSALPGAGLGAATAAGMTAAWVWSSPVVPFVGSQISSDALPVTRILAVAAIALAVTAMTWTMSGTQRVTTNRPLVTERRLSPWWILLGPALLWLTYALVWSARDSGVLFALLSWAFALATIPAVAISVAAAAGAVGTLLRRTSSSRGQPAGIVAGAWLATHTRSHVVLALTVIGVSTVAFQASQRVLALTAPGAEGREITRLVGPGVARVELGQHADRREAWSDVLPPGQSVVEVRRTTVVGDCRALTALDLPCGAPLQQAALAPRGRAVIAPLHLPSAARTESPASSITMGPGTYLVVATDGTTVDLGGLAVIAHEADGDTGAVTRLGQDWGTGEGYEIQARWVVVLTALGLALSFISVLVGGRQAAIDLARQMAPTSALFAPSTPRVLAVTSAVTAIPFVIAGLAAGYSGRIQAIPVLRKIRLSGALDDLTFVVVGGAVLATVFAAAWVMALTSRSASTWRPGQDDRDGR